MSDNGNLVVTAGEDDSCRFWDGVSGAPIGFPRPHDHTVVAVSISGNGSVAVSGSLDGTARIWRPEVDRPVGGPRKGDGNEFRLKSS